MKKFFAIMIALMCLVALSACGTNSGNSDSKSVVDSKTASVTTSSVEDNSNSLTTSDSGSVETSNSSALTEEVDTSKYVVTEAQWVSEINKLGCAGVDENVTVEVEEKNSGVVYVMEAANGTYCATQRSGDKVTTSYIVFDKSTYNSETNKYGFKYYSCNSNGEWSCSTSVGGSTSMSVDFWLGNVGMMFSNVKFSEVSYDASTNSYKCENITTEFYGAPLVIHSAEFKFENGKLVSFAMNVTYGPEAYAEDLNLVGTLSKNGSTTVTLPTVA